MKFSPFQTGGRGDLISDLADFHEIGVLWITLGQWRRTHGGQDVDAAVMVDPFLVELQPGSLPHRGHARQDAWCDLGGQSGFAALVEDAHQVTVLDTAWSGVNRVDPHFLTGTGLQVFDVAVGRVGTRLVVEAEKLQREFLS